MTITKGPGPKVTYETIDGEQYEVREFDGPLKVERTQRGFAIVPFRDVYDAQCSLQKSSLATEACIWIGPDKDRAHLSIPMVKALLPILQRFVETGEVTTDDAATA